MICDDLAGQNDKFPVCTPLSDQRAYAFTIWLFNIAMENNHFYIGKQFINGPFSMAMLNNQRVPAPLYPGRWDLAQRAALRMMWRSSPMWVGREPRAELHALSRFSQVSTRTAFSFRVVDFPGEEYKKRLPGKQYQYFQIPDGNNISWYPSLVKHFVSCFTCCDLPGFRPSSTQEDAMDFNLNCRRRLNCGAPWAFWWFQHVSACFSSKHVLWMSFPCCWSND